MAGSPQGACLMLFEINGLRADGSSGWIASLPTRRQTPSARMFTAMMLRPRQSLLVERTLAALDEYGNTLAVAPTGCHR
jgi:hypothetical protein